MIIKTKNPKEAIAYLKSSKNKILNYLKKVVNDKDFNYRTFGTAIEEHLTEVLIKLFKEGGFIKSNRDYIVAPDKNYFPDLELKTKPPLAIEFKSGNSSQYRKGKWVTVKNSENDMGTLNKWPLKIAKFGGENIYYIFVFYNLNDRAKEVLNIEIAPFYQFIGLSGGKVLKYREKDGNLRPKDFKIEPSIKTLKQFEGLFIKTVVYRSKRIIKKHRSIIKEAFKKH
ncbi:hypothetical protein KJ786_01105 [Patescibacteria group bacterium]|nr:hypothetical protein [Patescibacteria group bacterium]